MFILGGGPSLIGVDLSTRLHGRAVIGVNYSGILLPWVNVCWFGDCRWFDWNVNKLQKYPGLKVTCCERLHVVPWLRVLRRSCRAGVGIETEPGKVAWNHGSGGSAINFAWHLGAHRIVLLGFDLKRDENNRSHWHDEYTRVNPSQEEINYTYKRFRQGFDQIAHEAKGLGLEIFNANPDSSLDSFPRVPLEEGLRM